MREWQAGSWQDPLQATTLNGDEMDQFLIEAWEDTTLKALEDHSLKQIRVVEEGHVGYNPPRCVGQPAKGHILQLPQHILMFTVPAGIRV